MKTFKDLDFGPHSMTSHGVVEYDDARQAMLFFDNGYGISVISGTRFYTDLSHPYEIAVLKGNKDKCRLCYDTNITDDVIGYCNERKVSKVMKQIQSL